MAEVSRAIVSERVAMILWIFNTAPPQARLVSTVAQISTEGDSHQGRPADKMSAIRLECFNPAVIPTIDQSQLNLFIGVKEVIR